VTGPNFGSTGILRPGAHVQLDASVTVNPATLPDAGQMADSRGGIPHVACLEVGQDGEGLASTS
jgi:hypothetical protein